MIKIFKYKKVEVQVKTNIVKGGICYFGEKNIEANIEKIYNELMYVGVTDEQLLMGIYKGLTAINVAPYKITTPGFIYMGARMTDFTNQTKVKPEIKKEVDTAMEETKKETSINTGKD